MVFDEVLLRGFSRHVSERFDRFELTAVCSRQATIHLKDLPDAVKITIGQSSHPEGRLNDMVDALSSEGPDGLLMLQSSDSDFPVPRIKSPVLRSADLRVPIVSDRMSGGSDQSGLVSAPSFGTTGVSFRDVGL